MLPLDVFFQDENAPEPYLRSLQCWGSQRVHVYFRVVRQFVFYHSKIPNMLLPDKFFQGKLAPQSLSVEAPRLSHPRPHFKWFQCFDLYFSIVSKLSMQFNTRCRRRSRQCPRMTVCMSPKISSWCVVVSAELVEPATCSGTAWALNDVSSLDQEDDRVTWRDTAKPGLLEWYCTIGSGMSSFTSKWAKITGRRRDGEYCCKDREKWIQSGSVSTNVIGALAV